MMFGNTRLNNIRQHSSMQKQYNLRQQLPRAGRGRGADIIFLTSNHLKYLNLQHLP